MAKQFTLAKWRILIYCGAEHINCPLGSSAEEVFENAKSGKIAVARNSLPAISPDPFYAAMFTHEDFQLLRCKKLVVEAIGASMQKCRKDVLTSDRTLLILSSTKGDIDGIEDESPAATLSGLLADVCEELKFHVQ